MVNLATENNRQKFYNLWTIKHPDIILEQNKVIVPGTRYRFDFIHKPTKIAIEVCPNPWGSREYNKRKYSKYFLATIYGWTILMFGENMINRDYLSKTAKFIKKKNENLPSLSSENA